MAQQAAPTPQVEFHGVYLAGNPVGRPSGTAAKCQDFRIMPGQWLRLRGGRKARYNTTGGEVQQIHSFREVNFPGSSNQLTQIKYSGPTVRWTWFSLLSYIIDPAGIEQVTLTYDSSYGASNPLAVCNLSDRPLYYQGLGVRDATNSRPPFSTYSTAVRYFGLDAFSIGGNPTVSFAAGPGNNTVATAVEIWVGLYHSATEHYSNGVYAGTIGPTGATGTITAANLTRLKAAYHNTTEQNELFYVFYATIDGGRVPYLILNSTLDGPYKVSIATASTSLSIAASTTNGWNLDLTKEVPTENFPPRPMRSLAFVNQRLYGALMNGGSGAAVSQTKVGGGSRLDFTYIPTSRDLAAVVWSAAASDVQDRDFLGDPLQSWPLANIIYTPNAQQPLKIAPSIEGDRVLVITAGGTFLLEEQADGLHTFSRVSLIHGIGVVNTFCETRYGQMWVDQRNQIVLLRSGEGITILSTPYQNLLDGKTVRCADYLLNPPGEIDRYQVWFSDGTSVIHDFVLGGEAYTTTAQDFTAAATLAAQDGKIHHVVAKGGFYTQEVQPDTATIPTTDETYSDTTTQTFTAAEIPTGEYHRNWDDFGDSNRRKDLPFVDYIGDGKDASPSLDFYRDFDAQIVLPGEWGVGGQGDPANRFKLKAASAYWYKLVLKLTSHSAQASTYISPAIQGDQASNFYGSIVRLLMTFGQSVNRS